MEVPNSMNKLIDMQKRLMEEVPHHVSPTAFVKMGASVKILSALLRFLNSTGHKPWRPVPLPPSVQDSLMSELEHNVELLKYIHISGAGADRDFSEHEHFSRQLVSSFGVIEETLEYLDSLTTSDRAHQLEEITDILFFYLEQLILGGFSCAEIEEEYVRKWHVNMERYEKAKKGDYSWDKRSERGL